MAFTCRLSDELHERAARHARRVGVSFSALVSIALDDYLTGKESSAAPPAAPPERSEPLHLPKPAPPAPMAVAASSQPQGSPAFRLAERKRLERLAKK